MPRPLDRAPVAPGLLAAVLRRARAVVRAARPALLPAALLPAAVLIALQLTCAQALAHTRPSGHVARPAARAKAAAGPSVGAALQALSRSSAITPAASQQY